MEKRDVVVVSAGRTPMGRFGGTLKDMLVYDLGAVAISGVLKRSGLGRFTAISRPSSFLSSGKVGD
jgi:acetyl-CoA C-acetyltransferase